MCVCIIYINTYQYISAIPQKRSIITKCFGHKLAIIIQQKKQNDESWVENMLAIF